jgi:5-methylcytosine-specific restriction endonuclease McrA
LKRPGSKERIRSFFRANLGRVVTAGEIRDAIGQEVSEWARRLRELRDEEGWPIRSHNDDARLKPGEYLLEEAPPEKRRDLAFARTISAKLRAEVLDRNGFTCQMCGLTPGDIDSNTGRKVRLHIGHIVDKSLGGQDVLSNLRTLCSTCNQGAKNITGEKPTAIWLLSQVRRAALDDQRAIHNWLSKKFRQSD